MCRGSQCRYSREVFELGEDIHVPERVDGDDGTISRGFLDMEQGVAELFAVGMQKVNGACRGCGELVRTLTSGVPGLQATAGRRSRTFLADELPSHFMLELLQTVCILLNVEQDEERDSFFSQLLEDTCKNTPKVSETDGRRCLQGHSAQEGSNNKLIEKSAACFFM